MKFLYFALFSALVWLIYLLKAETIVQFLVSHGWLFEHENMILSQARFTQSIQERITQKFAGLTIIVSVFFLFLALLSNGGKPTLSSILARIPKDTGFNLITFRSLFCLGLVISLLIDGPTLPEGIYNPIDIFEFLNIPLVSQSAFQIIYAILLASLIMAISGFYARLGLHLSWITYFLYQGTRLGFLKSEFSNYVQHSENLAPIILLILAFTQSHAISLNRAMKEKIPLNSRALFSIQMLVAIAYFGAGYCKIITTPYWADGFTLQAYLTEYFLTRDNLWALWVAQNLELCTAISLLTLLFEMFFFYCVFFPKLRPALLIAGLIFHTAVYVTIDLNFLQLFILAYFAFLPWERLREFLLEKLKLKNCAPSNKEKSPISPAREKFIPIFFISIFLFCVLFRVEFWPFSDFRVFQNRFELKNLKVYRLAEGNGEGGHIWLRSKNLKIGKSSLNYRLQQMALHGNSDPDLIRHASLYVKENTITKGEPIFLFARTASFGPEMGNLKIKEENLGQVNE